MSGVVACSIRTFYFIIEELTPFGKIFTNIAFEQSPLYILTNHFFLKCR